MNPLVSTLSGYAPRIILSKIADNPALQYVNTDESFQTAVMFADISGFTALAEHLASRSSSGAEDLSLILNNFFGQWIEIVEKYNGDIIKFAGDALTVIWPAENLESALLQAAHCASEAQQKLRQFKALDRQLFMRIAIGGGDMRLARLGGIYNRWEYLVLGEPIEQISSAQAYAKPGQIILSPQVWKHLSRHCNGEILSSGQALLHSIITPAVSPTQLPIELGESAIPALRAYIPGAIAQRIDAGQSDWLAELRRVTILFINLPGLSCNSPSSELQIAIESIQKSVYYYQGGVNKVMVDEKGVSIMAALGLPPFSHEDDPARGALAAMDTQTALNTHNLECCIGVTTGRVFCGVIGNQTRREYTMIGDPVNLSSRLMQAAHRLSQEKNQNISILSDYTTFESAQERVGFRTLDSILVKGKAQPIAIFQPEQKRERISLDQNPATLIGRESERMEVADTLRQLVSGADGILIIQGEAGIGKSRLAHELLRQGQAMGIFTCMGTADSIEDRTPYYTWRPIVAQLFGVDYENSIEEQRRQWREIFTKDPTLSEKAPMLSPLLPLNLPDNPHTAQITGQARADNMHQLIIGQIQKQAGRRPVLLIIEDAHWADTATWALIRHAHERIHPLLVAIITRPVNKDNSNEDYLTLANHPGVRLIELQSLPQESIHRLVCQRLGVTKLPPEVLEFIRLKAEGHPFFSEELAYALRDTGLLTVKDGEATLNQAIDELNRLNFPTTIEGVITSRIDQLKPSQQLILKVASVIGRVFAFRLLRDIYPIESDKTLLSEHMDALESLDLTLLESPEPDLEYIFKHIITQEVAYNLLLVAQRRSLHAAVANWYERIYGDASTIYSALAYHWSRAEVYPKALEYLEKAGNQALLNGAYDEAVKFFEQAIQLLKEEKSPVRQAHWERMIGEAYMGMGNMVKASQHLRKTAGLLDHPVPTSQTTLLANLVIEILAQTAHRTLPQFFMGRFANKREATLEAAQTHSHLGHIEFFQSNPLPLIYHSFKALNLAEAAGGTSIPLAWATATLSAIIGIFPIHPLAEMYGLETDALVAKIDDPKTQVWGLLATSVYALGLAKWEKCATSIPQAIEIGHSASDNRLLGDGIVVLAGYYYMRGDFSNSYAQYTDLLTRAMQYGNLQQQVWGLGGQAINLMRQGKLEESLAALQRNSEAWSTVKDQTQLNNHAAITAYVLWLLGEKEAARQKAKEALPLILSTAPTQYAQMMGYTVMADLLFLIWEDLHKTGAAQEQINATKQQTASVVQLLAKFSKSFPIGTPATQLYHGMQHAMQAQPQKAIGSWQKARNTAIALRMPYEEARACYILGIHATTAETRRELIEKALHLFEQQNAFYDAEQARNQLQSVERKQP